MAVVFDASFLIPLLDENARIDVPNARRKVNYLVAELEKAREVIAVPTPALSEFLSSAGEAGPKYLQIIGASARFRVVDFDTLAAVEAAAELVEAKRAGDKKGGVDASWQKIKFDRQIIAIARVTGATKLYSHDPHFKTRCEGAGGGGFFRPAAAAGRGANRDGVQPGRRFRATRRLKIHDAF